jgi:hypothetical protein
VWRISFQAATGKNLIPDPSRLEWLLALAYPAILGLVGAVALVANIHQLVGKHSEMENWKECPVFYS